MAGGSGGSQTENEGIRRKREALLNNRPGLEAGVSPEREDFRKKNASIRRAVVLLPQDWGAKDVKTPHSVPRSDSRRFPDTSITPWDDSVPSFTEFRAPPSDKVIGK